MQTVFRKKQNTFFKLTWTERYRYKRFGTHTRGNLITLNKKEKRLREEKFQEIQNKIINKEQELKKKPDKKKIMREVKILQEQFNGFFK